MKHATNEQEQARRYLSVLELEPGASFQNVKRAYKDLCFVWHPDRQPERLKKRATKKLQHLNEAYAWLAEHAALLETGAHSHQEKRIHQATYRLRREPLTVSEEEAEEAFKTKKSGWWVFSVWRPLKHIQNNFEDQADVVLDRATGLMWQKSGSLNSMTYENAQAYITQLNGNRFAGYNDWRWPTIPELMSLIEPERQSNELHINPIFDKTQKWCWSTDKISERMAWAVYFISGYVQGYGLLGRFYVRCVRS